MAKTFRPYEPDQLLLMPPSLADWVPEGHLARFVRDLVDWGAGPRAGQFLINGGKALAAMDGRFSVAIEDVKKVAVPVLRHRLSTNFQAQAEGMTTEDVILRLLKEVKEPEVAKFA